VFEDRLWAQDLQRWDDVEKPAALGETWRLAAIEPSELSDDALAGYFGDCFAHLSTALGRHHSFNLAYLVPVGSFLLQAEAWGLPPGLIVEALDGASPISAGQSSQLDALVAALRRDAEARAMLTPSEDPAAIVRALRSREGETGIAARLYFDWVGYIAVGGFDPIDTYALERPETLIEHVSSAVEKTTAAEAKQGRDAIAQARSLVPDSERRLFDSLIAEARLVHRLKDERGIFNDHPARGLVRRAALEAGHRLVAIGVLEDPEHLLEGDLHEIQQALRDPASLDAASLVERYEFRLSNSDLRPR
jgi:pyruvate,water dikinase